MGQHLSMGDIAVLFLAHPCWHVLSALSHGLWMKYIGRLVLEEEEKTARWKDKKRKGKKEAGGGGGLGSMEDDGGLPAIGLEARRSDPAAVSLRTPANSAMTTPRRRSQRIAAATPGGSK
jgi:hypothetical protein